MLNVLLKVVGVLAAAVLIAALSVTWVVVRVAPEDGPTILVPAPAILGQLALAWSPAADEELELDVKLMEHRESALAAIRELRGAADAELVRVEDGDETVSVWKRGDGIAIEALLKDQTVKVNASLAVVESFLEGLDGGPIRVQDLAALVRRLDAGKAVEVRSADVDVDVWIW